MFNSTYWFNKYMLLVSVAIALALIIICDLLFTAASSSQPPEERLQVMLETGNDCYPPCWHGLIPQKSTKKDVEKFLQSAPSNLLSPKQPYSDQSYVKFPFVLSQIKSEGTLYTEGDLLKQIVFRANFINLGLLLESLGPPDKYSAAIWYDIKPYIGFDIFYEEKGIVVTFYTELKFKSGCTLISSLEIPAKWIYFAQPNDGKDMLITILGNLHTGREVIQEWHGTDNIVLDPC